MTELNRLSLKTLNSVFQMLVLLVTLAACSGGISGTGNGEPIIVVDTGDTTQNPSDSNIPDATGDSIIENLQVFPGNLVTQSQIGSIMPTLNGADSGTADYENAILTKQLMAQIGTYNETVKAIAMDIILLESHLLAAHGSCELQGSCSTVPSTISVQGTPTTENYSDILFTQGFPGIFDKEFSYTREDGAQVTLQWNNQEDLLYFFIDTINATTYSYTDKQQNTVTLRHINKASSSVLQATIVTNSDSSITVEADLVEWYLRGTLTPQTTLIYAVNQQSPTNRREATTPDGSTVVTETCDRSNCLWQSEFSNSATEVFGNTESSLGDFSQTINNQQGITLPSSPDRLVISTSDDNGSPALQSVSCGSVRVLDRRRTFCWQTFPAADERFVYEEIYNSGITGYRQVATAP